MGRAYTWYSSPLNPTSNSYAFCVCWALSLIGISNGAGDWNYYFPKIKEESDSRYGHRETCEIGKVLIRLYWRLHPTAED